MDTKKLTGIDTPGCFDSFSEDADRGQVLMDRLLVPSDHLTKWGKAVMRSTPTGDAFVALHLNKWKAETMNLAAPYGEGNHHRISWRRNWDVDREALTATHKPTGFVLAFTPHSEGGYTALPGCELPAFGPDGTLAMAQMFGLRELLKDGWEIFHTVMRKA